MRAETAEESGVPLLRSGFRPFFMGAALSSSASLALWLYWLILRAPGPARWPGLYWHGHEMMFGFVAAAVAGFALTAVPNWTETERVRSRRLGVWGTSGASMPCA